MSKGTLLSAPAALHTLRLPACCQMQKIHMFRYIFARAKHMCCSTACACLNVPLMQQYCQLPICWLGSMVSMATHLGSAANEHASIQREGAHCRGLIPACGNLHARAEIPQLHCPIQGPCINPSMQ